MRESKNQMVGGIMTDNHTELCERLRQASIQCSDCGMYETSSDFDLAVSMIESQSARIQQQALEYVSLFDQCSQTLDFLKELKEKIAELEKERDALKADAERYEYLLDCDVEAARRYLPSLDADEFKNVRRARHSVALQAEKETRS